MPATILNDDLDFNTAPEHVHRAFLERRPQKRLFIPGFELYKFTQSSLFKPDGTVTEWWSSVEPLNPADPGLAETLKRAQRLDVRPDQFVRARSAVTRQWNRMDRLLRARLLTSVWGFVGRCSGQRFDQDESFQNVSFIGGAYQLWMPNLTRLEIAEVSFDHLFAT